MKKCRKSRVRLPLRRRSIVSANACKVVAHRRFVFVRNSSSCFRFTMPLFFTCLQGRREQELKQKFQLQSVLLLAYRGLSEEEGTGTQAEVSASKCLVTCLQGIVRRGGNRNSSRSFSFKVSCYLLTGDCQKTREHELKQKFSFKVSCYLLTGDCQKRREQVRSSSSCFSSTISCFFTCFQGTVRRGGNNSGAPAAVLAPEYLAFLLAYRGLSEEEGTSQELQQLF
jgi:hypothetical protein